MSATPVRRTHRIANATPRQVYDVVVDFPAYPRLFRELSSARVLSTNGPVVRVEFRAQLLVAVRYVLDLTCDPDALTVDWTYVEGEILTDSTGGWRFTAAAADTDVEYRAAVEIKAPLPGFVIRKVTDGLVAASLPAMFTALEREVASRR